MAVQAAPVSLVDGVEVGGPTHGGLRPLQGGGDRCGRCGNSRRDCFLAGLAADPRGDPSGGRCLTGMGDRTYRCVCPPDRPPVVAPDRSVWVGADSHRGRALRGVRRLLPSGGWIPHGHLRLNLRASAGMHDHWARDHQRVDMGSVRRRRRDPGDRVVPQCTILTTRTSSLSVTLAVAPVSACAYDYELVLMTAKAAPAGSARTAKRPGGMSVGAMRVVAPSFSAAATVASVSETAK
jgi:hypothetical protein